MKIKRRYGLEFDERVPDHQIELMLSRFHTIPEYAAGNLDSPDTHFLRAIRMLFTPEEFRINAWTEKIVHAWCNYTMTVLMGCAAANKSHSCGMVALLDWMTAPTVTSTFFSSTTVKALEKRSWASVLHFYQILKRKGLPAVHAKSRTAILNESDARLEELGHYSPDAIKSGIFGLAVMSGPVENAISNLIGVHQPTWDGGVRMFADEAQAVKQAYLDARTNLMIGTPDFRIVLLGNPMSWEDPLGELARPKDGIESITIEDEDWETREGGICIHFDGHKSPAVVEPDGEKNYPFLIGPKHIAQVRRRCNGNEGHPQYQTMVRGWIASTTDPDVIIPKPAQVHYGMLRPGMGWLYDPVTVMALDPSYSAKGDDAVIQVAWAGTEADGVFRIVFHPEPIYVPIVDSKEDPVINQICRFTWATIVKWEVDTRYLVVDEAATQTVGSTLFLLAPPDLADSSVRPLLFNGATRPSELVMSIHDRRTGNDLYGNAATEAWFWMESFARFGQIRGLPKRASSGYASRKVEASANRRQGTRSLESKKKLKDRGLPSPNEADACSMIVALVRHRLGAVPGDFRHNALRHLANMQGQNTFFSGSTEFDNAVKIQDSLNSPDESYASEGW